MHRASYTADYDDLHDLSRYVFIYTHTYNLYEPINSSNLQNKRQWNLTENLLLQKPK